MLARKKVACPFCFTLSMVITMFAEHPRMVTLHDRVMAHPRIAAYLSSSRRLAFNEQGIFRPCPGLGEE
jgi:Glutathione S-transferase, C-terminal domain